MKALPPAAEDVVLEGVVVEHNGVPLGNQDWFGWETFPWPKPRASPTFNTWGKTSANFVVDGDRIYDAQTGQRIN